MIFEGRLNEAVVLLLGSQQGEVFRTIVLATDSNFMHGFHDNLLLHFLEIIYALQQVVGNLTGD
jgi:hypothetical protein